MTIARFVVLLELMLCTAMYAQPASKISVHHNPNHEISIAVNPQIHRDYGLAYPMTYQIAVPAGSSDLRAWRKHLEAEEWAPITEKKPEDFFNGVEAVRFDYANHLAYLSVAFGETTDSIYIKITNQTGQNVPVEYKNLSRYYDNRAAAVTVTADDWHPYFDQQFLYALNIFRKHNLWVSTAIVTEWCDAQTWQHIQTQLDSGYVEAIAHGRNHLHVPYPDPAYEVTGSKTDIIDNLKLPDLFRNGEQEYVYVWVAPYGEYNDEIDALVSENQYLVSRVVYFGEQGFSDWESARNKYAPIGVMREMGPLWGGSDNLADLNLAFDTAIAAQGVYHVMCHPHVLYDGQWSKPYTREHLKHISNRKNLWYVSMGHLYLYHFLQDKSAFPVSVAATLGPLPLDFRLSQNYPNPFNPTTRIDYQLPQAGHVRLSIYDALGQLVKNLIDQKQPVGTYSLEWKAVGKPSGAYFYRMQVNGAAMSRRMLLIK